MISGRNRWRWTVLAVAVMVPCLNGCDGEDGKVAGSGGAGGGVFVLACPGFAAGSSIPKKHTGDGRDVSPELTWTGVPKNTRELALIVDDPDAPGAEPWVHWVVYGIAGDSGGLAEGALPNDDGGKGEPPYHGLTSWGTTGYRGPKPPVGHGVHHYHFKLYASDGPLGAAEDGMSKADLLAAMEGHVLAETELVGTYER